MMAHENKTLLLSTFAVITWAGLVAPASTQELPLTENVPISEFQNRTEDVKGYDFDAPPEGLFRSITTAESFEEEIGHLRTHEIVPVRPTDQFPPDIPAVFIVFALHQHYQGFNIFGRCFPETVPGLSRETLISEDVVHITLEDNSGYLSLRRPAGGWRPGRYRVEIHVGEEVNELSLMGTMRFTIVNPSP